ncbi:hypothetical protein M441DRAFT_42160 [Trichoderma asperellum CBS 433.97]|uniref:Uncharacterized protein n=1 Tax=Trichoderma asperellum (strain ATCC 204424 / CBS 433.97 / NBRC 101777) TaxID=1042311 RepID=A0A2T3ZNI2_TRIA4|nr:hypothetical protein M441DRAFT_42160 [Trichoderma asperellum CBS 433.97]PTB46348.1 hypothetical protein M441DRAFT_42160 [Trichoderma asperellum CBS 433.97]
MYVSRLLAKLLVQGSDAIAALGIILAGWLSCGCETCVSVLCIYLLSRQQLRTGKRQWENTALRRTDSSPRILRLRNQGPATGRVCFRLQTLSDFIRASAEHRLGSFSYTDPPPSAGGSTCCPVCTNQKVRAWGVIVSVLHQARQRLGAPNPICWEIRFEGARRASGPYTGDWPDGTPHPKWPISVTTADDSAEPQRRKKRGKETNASLPAATLPPGLETGETRSAGMIYCNQWLADGRAAKRQDRMPRAKNRTAQKYRLGETNLKIW